MGCIEQSEDHMKVNTIKQHGGRNFFRAFAESAFLYGSATWTMTKANENMLDGIYTQMLRAV